MFEVDLKDVLSRLKAEKLPVMIGLMMGMCISVSSFDSISIAGQMLVDTPLTITQESASLVVLNCNKSLASNYTYTILSTDVMNTATHLGYEELTEYDSKRVADEKEAEASRIAYENSLSEEQREVDMCNNAELNVPNWNSICNSNKKTYMPYTSVTDKTSLQFDLVHGSSAYTDQVSGIRMVDGRYCIAVGSYYCLTAGTKIDLVMEDNSIVKCIMGDAKANRDTNASSQFDHTDGSVVEFLVDYDVFLNVRDTSGTVNFVDALKGKILKIVVLP